MGCGGSKKSGVVDTQTKPQNTKPPAAKGPSDQRSPVKPATKSSANDTPRDKYVVNGAANGASSHRDSVFSEATDKGFKRRLREKMKEATAGNDMEELEKSMDKFQKQKLEDCGDYSKAVERLHFLTLKRDLRDAVRRRHVGVLEKAILEAESSQYRQQLHNHIEAAQRMLQHLKELNEYKHDILMMEQSTISEIHSYQRPPNCVHDVMMATYMLLGHPEPRLTDWADIQILLCRVGRDSLIHEIRDFDSANVDNQTTNRVQEILHPHELHTIRQASNGAATFYVWSTQICDKVERDNAAVGDREQNQGRNGQTAEETDSRKKQKG